MDGISKGISSDISTRFLPSVINSFIVTRKITAGGQISFSLPSLTSFQFLRFYLVQVVLSVPSSRYLWIGFPLYCLFARQIFKSTSLSSTFIIKSKFLSSVLSINRPNCTIFTNTMLFSSVIGGRGKKIWAYKTFWICPTLLPVPPEFICSSNSCISVSKICLIYFFQCYSSSWNIFNFFIYTYYKGKDFPFLYLKTTLL